MNSVKYLTVSNEEDGKRLDKWFKNRFPMSTHGYLQKLLRTGQVRLDGCRVKANGRVKSGQKVRVPPMDFSSIPKHDENSSASFYSAHKGAGELRDRILYKDEDILAIDKPQGLAVQGGSRITVHIDAMLDGLKFEKIDRPRLVHRLDRDTSGVLLLARTESSARWLSASFKVRQLQKLYWALIIGPLKRDEGIIDLKLRKKLGRNGEKVAAVSDGKVAQTAYRVVDRASHNISWLALEPITGRTHQLRAHTALGLDAPIIGDGKYGGYRAFAEGLPNTKSMQLHSRAIMLTNPIGKKIFVKAPLPEGMRENFNFLGFYENDERANFIKEIN